MKPKLIIFDLDGTLYDLSDVHSANYVLQVEFLMQEMHISEQEAIDLQERNNIYPIITDESKSATELFAKMGLDMNEWKNFREEHFDVTRIDKSKAVSADIIEQFASICPLVLLSSNSYRNILTILQYLNIDTNLFDSIYCSDNIVNNEPFNKKRAMKILAEKYKIACRDILSIGDRYQTDVAPIEDLGGSGIVVRGKDNVKQIISQLL